MPKREPRFIPTSGKVHVLNVAAECATVKTAVRKGTWKGRRSISPEAALALDGCDKCQTHKRAREAIGHDEGAAKDRTARTMDQSVGKQTWYLTDNGGWTMDAEYASRDEDDNIIRKTVMPGRKGPPKVLKPKKSAARKTTTSKKAPKSKREPKLGITKGRSIGGGLTKAEQLAEFGEEHGWECEVEEITDNKVKVVAQRGDQTIECNFTDGKYDQDDHAFIQVGDWKGLLTGAHRVRRQMSGERPLFPKPGEGKSASPKAKPSSDTDDEEDSAGALPWLADDDDATKLRLMRGHVIEWRNSISGRKTKAEVPPNGNSGLYPHPKRDVQVLRFAEVVYDDNGTAQLGGERHVALDRIVRIT